MDWASNVVNERPDLNQIYVKKDTVSTSESFMEFINLYNLSIFTEEPDYYILEGSKEDLDEFKYYWNYDT